MFCLLPIIGSKTVYRWVGPQMVGWVLRKVGGAKTVTSGLPMSPTVGN